MKRNTQLHFLLFLFSFLFLIALSCEAHDLARASYVRIVETDVTLAIRSLSICLEAVQSRVKLVETFELGTLIFARLAESCSSMAIQSTTPETLGKVLTEYFNSINDLNEALAGKINSFILAQSDADREDAKINLSKSIQQLETLVLEVQTIVQEELASVDRQDYFQEFIEETEEVTHFALFISFLFSFLFFSFFSDGRFSFCPSFFPPSSSM